MQQPKHIAQAGLRFSFSPSLPKLLHEHQCTLALSTYDAGKLFLISSLDGKHLRHFVKIVKRPMGIAVKDHKLAVASLSQVMVFGTSPRLARQFPDKRDYYDAFYLPRAVYFTGTTDVHDISWGQDGLWAVNTIFSCLSLIDENYSFTPRWQPPFISELHPEDRCHLNGMTMENGQPAYVTLLATTDEKEGWRKHMLTGGQLIHVPTNEVLLDQLPIPHSPRLVDGRLYFLLSATGQVMEYDRQKREVRELSQANGFLRGMGQIGNYLFVGLSTIRQTSRTFRDLPIRERAHFAGVEIIDRTSGENLGGIIYTEGIKELFDVSILPNTVRATIVDPGAKLPDRAIMGPGKLVYWKKEKQKKEASPPKPEK